ncbi:hypothetical protein EFL81_09925 [Weissella confusa]|uniref:hypothetical protein n=1 Tax=Weissella confusa TaxID=1583 RepID=UPI00223C05F8|nr:hypothetical protein [Weissella confusa]MCS9997128.1 hypothetical protein [Weissella confusa]
MEYLTDLYLKSLDDVPSVSDDVGNALLLEDFEQSNDTWYWVRVGRHKTLSNDLAAIDDLTIDNKITLWRVVDEDFY